MPRLFLALWPNAETRAALAAAAGALDLRDARAVPPENLHLTLHFLGEVEAGTAATLRRALLSPPVPPFSLDFARVGWWRRARVAWLAPLDPPAALVRLVDALAGQLAAQGLAPDGRTHCPHVTVARAMRRAPRVTGTIAVHWPITAFALVESRTEPAGARYEVLQSWTLEGSPA